MSCVSYVLFVLCDKRLCGVPLVLFAFVLCVNHHVSLYPSSFSASPLLHVLLLTCIAASFSFQWYRQNTI
jgi:hypothetical protein